MKISNNNNNKNIFSLGQCPSNMNSEYNHPTINHKGWTPHEEHNAIGHIQCSVRPRGASSIWILWYGVGVLFGAQNIFFSPLVHFVSTDWSMRLFFRFYSKFIGAEFYGIFFFNAKNLFFREFDKFRLVLVILRTIENGTFYIFQWHSVYINIDSIFIYSALEPDKMGNRT